jgi:transposase
VPDEIGFECDKSYTFVLHDELGTPRLQYKPDKSGVRHPQTRTLTFTLHEKTGTYRCAGKSTSDALFTAADGWLPQTFKFRLYRSHAGIETDREGLAYLDSLAAQRRAAFNAGAYLCVKKQRECYAALQPELAKYRDEFVIPAIKTFNDSLGRSKEKLRHPKGIGKKYLTLSPFRRLIAQIKHREADKLTNPLGLRQNLEEFVARLQGEINYEPTNTLKSAWPKLFAETLTEKEITVIPAIQKAVEAQMATTIGNRKNMAFDKGWPKPKYEEDGDDWIFSQHIDAAGIPATKLFAAKGFGGLRIGTAIVPQMSGHPAMLAGSLNTRRSFRPVTFMLPGNKGEERQPVTLAGLIHREFPAGCHIKQWTLSKKDDKMWLCLSLLVQFPKTQEPNLPAAGVDVGWYIDPATRYVRLATVHHPGCNEERFVTVDFEGVYGCKADQKFGRDEAKKANDEVNQREAFHVRLGASSWGRGNIKRDQAKASPLYETQAEVTEQVRQTAEAIKEGLITLEEARGVIDRYLTLSDEFVFVDTFSGIVDLQKRRSELTECVKQYVLRSLGNDAPIWAAKMGSRGMRKLGGEPEANEAVRSVIGAWSKTDERFARYHAWMAARITGRRKTEYERVANDIMRWLQGSVSVVRVEDRFVKKVAESVTPLSDYGLRHGQRYRQWVAPSDFIETLRKTAPKYGSEIERMEAAWTTRWCRACDKETTPKDPAARKQRCLECNNIYDQDQNAAQNLADPSEVLRKRQVA